MKDLPKRPWLAPWYQLLDKDEKVLLKSGDVIIEIEGKSMHNLLRRILPLLDGLRKREDIYNAFKVEEREIVDRLLTTLVKENIVIDKEDENKEMVISNTQYDVLNFFRATECRYENKVVEVHTIAKLLNETKVGIIGDSFIADEIARMLKLSLVKRVEKVKWPIVEDKVKDM